MHCSTVPSLILLLGICQLNSLAVAYLRQIAPNSYDKFWRLLGITSRAESTTQSPFKRAASLLDGTGWTLPSHEDCRRQQGYAPTRSIRVLFYMVPMPRLCAMYKLKLKHGTGT